MSPSFRLVSDFSPRGHQPEAIEALARGFADPRARQVLLGVTGSGKTFTVAQLIQRLQAPALVIAPNKTLAAQLYQEFRDLFPENAVSLFVSYYDYYQPEAYVPSTDTYIEKDARINERIDRLRNGATAALVSRRDVIVVASVSCIYGLGDPENYSSLALRLSVGSPARREEIVRGLVRTQHVRAEVDWRPGGFRLRGPAVEVWPIHEQDRVLRIELAEERVESLLVVDPLTGEVLDEPQRATIFPVGHYVQPEEKLPRALLAIRAEMEQCVRALRAAGKALEAERLERRTLSDLEDLEELGFCSGIENYSRHFEGRQPGQPPFTLLHYFPKDFLCVLDESHVTLPQVYGMSVGDRARKRNLVDYGFRLPCAVDNRPLDQGEFESLLGRALYVSATPAPRELALAGGRVVEQLVRPTGLLDPECEVKPARAQVEDALAESRRAVEAGGRVLITTLTKRSAEDLTEFLQEQGVRARYLHSDVDAIERSELLRDLRLGVYDVLVGINLLREGLDLPEVSLVLVLDADREGFLRSATSLIQTCGRAARNEHGRVVLYADHETAALKTALDEAARRRTVQEEFNRVHDITPRGVRKKIADSLAGILDANSGAGEVAEGAPLGAAALERKLAAARRAMLQAASDLDFEQAIRLRDELRRLESLQLELAGP